MAAKKISIIIILILIIFAIVLFFKFPRETQNQKFNYESKQYKLGEAEVNLKLADSPEKRQKGLSRVYELSENEGMIFVFEESDILSFWNKDTFLDLDVVWIRNGRIVGIEKLQKEENGRQVIYAPASCNVAVELNQGFCQKYDIKIGDKLEALQ